MPQYAPDLPPLWQPGPGFQRPLTASELSQPGRPPIRSADLVAALLDRLRRGVPLKVIGREDGMPDPRTVRRWQAADPRSDAAVVAARLEGYDLLRRLVEEEARANRKRMSRREARRIFNRRCLQLAKQAPGHFGWRPE